MSIVLTRPALTGRRLAGRHRLGSPGLIPVTVLVTVVRRGLFSSWLRRGRHRWTAAARSGQSVTVLPLPATAREPALHYPSAA